MDTPQLPAHITLDTDLELSGGINRSASEGAKFSLLLAMLHSNVLDRPGLQQADDPPTLPSEALTTGYYRRPALKPSQQDWHHLDQAKRILHSSPNDAQLYQAMHPQPLSLHNDGVRIDDIVAFNCDYYAQQRLRNLKGEEEKKASIQVDETGLYDILQSLDVQPGFAA